MDVCWWHVDGYFVRLLNVLEYMERNIRRIQNQLVSMDGWIMDIS